MGVNVPLDLPEDQIVLTNRIKHQKEVTAEV